MFGRMLCGHGMQTVKHNLSNLIFQRYRVIYSLFIFCLFRLNATGHSLSHLLPDIVPSGTKVGTLTFDWEGVPAGASVYVALGDLQCSVYPFLEREELNSIAGKCKYSLWLVLYSLLYIDFVLVNFFALFDGRTT